ncbi:MAG: hypothetical protein H0X28_06340 [Solirubrobacterales bacterium]|nr:hypothetical protein [Solirubrobacterales bacterium]
MTTAPAVALPRSQRAARINAASRAVHEHERLFAALLALSTAVVAFGPRIRVGGFNADDWAVYAAKKFPETRGFHSAFAALQADGGSRIGHVFYWLISFSLFGGHTKLYSAMAALLAVVLACTVYVLLRELHFGMIESLAMMVLTIVAPSIGAVRFWFTPGGIQIDLALFILGLIVALRAFDAPPERRTRLHVASWSLYVASAAYAETALPLMGCSLLVYLTRTGVAASLRRWAWDLAVVVVGYLATLSFVSSRSGFEKLAPSMWGEHANLLAGQSLTVFTRMLGPLSAADRTLGLSGVGALGVACLVLWRRGNVRASSRQELMRWGVTFLICMTGGIASYAVFVPAMLYYEPLGPGLATHINAVTAAPLAVAVFAVVMLTRIVCFELFGDRSARVGYVLVTVAVAWYAAIALESMHNVRSDGRIWAAASSRDYHVLHILTKVLPHPLHNATIYTFGEAGTVAPGMPVFFTSWEQENAVKIAYERPDVSSFPVVSNGIQASCGVRGISAIVGTKAVNAPSAYGLSYFLDIPSGRYQQIGSMADCTAALSRFHAGPYVVTPALEWAS